MRVAHRCLLRALVPAATVPGHMGECAPLTSLRDSAPGPVPGRRTQQLLGPNVKLPVAPDPLQSFLAAAAGAPALLPEPDTPAPEQAPGAAVSGAPSMPNVPAGAPAAQLPGDAQLPGSGLPDIFASGGSLFPDIFAEAPAVPVAAKARSPSIHPWPSFSRADQAERMPMQTPAHGLHASSWWGSS